MKSANDNKLSLVEQALENMGSSTPSSEVAGIANLRGNLVFLYEKTGSAQLKEDIDRCDAIIKKARELGVY